MVNPPNSEDFQTCCVLDLDAYRERRKEAGLSTRGAAKKPPAKVPHVVALMKKALEFAHLLASGEVESRAEFATREGITRARLTQIMKRLGLAPDIQEAILALPAGTPERLVTERKLQKIVDLSAGEKEAAYREMVGAAEEAGSA